MFAKDNRLFIICLCLNPHLHSLQVPCLPSGITSHPVPWHIGHTSFVEQSFKFFCIWVSDILFIISSNVPVSITSFIFKFPQCNQLLCGYGLGFSIHFTQLYIYSLSFSAEKPVSLPSSSAIYPKIISPHWSQHKTSLSDNLSSHEIHPPL